jgi:hypothetical protein
MPTPPMVGRWGATAISHLGAEGGHIHDCFATKNHIHCQKLTTRVLLLHNIECRHQTRGNIRPACALTWAAALLTLVRGAILFSPCEDHTVTTQSHMLIGVQLSDSYSLDLLLIRLLY